MRWLGIQVAGSKQVGAETHIRQTCIRVEIFSPYVLLILCSRPISNTIVSLIFVPMCPRAMVFVSAVTVTIIRENFCLGLG
jgi:hypothetical protein